MIKISLLGMILLSLIGCAGYNSSFECKANSGIGCKSVSKVNAMIDKGQLPNDQDGEIDKKIKKQTIKAKHKLPFPQVIPDKSLVFVVHRKPESVLRIWLAPYVDKNGAYQEAQYIHEVVETGAWVEEPAV